MQNDEEALSSIIMAGIGLLVKMLITLDMNRTIYFDQMFAY